MRLYVQDESQLYSTTDSTASKDKTRSSLCPNTCGYSKKNEEGKRRRQQHTSMKAPQFRQPHSCQHYAPSTGTAKFALIVQHPLSQLAYTISEERSS